MKTPIEVIEIGGAFPGTVEWLDDNDAIVRCNHDYPLVVYAAACHKGADLDDVVAEVIEDGVWHVGPLLDEEDANGDDT